MSAIGGSELVIIVLVAAVLLMPSRLAGIGRSFGGALRAFKQEVSGAKPAREGKAAPRR